MPADRREQETRSLQTGYTFSSSEQDQKELIDGRCRLNA